MKILMFGWEFPPHITGGLGTACFGLTKGLANHDVDVIFVVPKAYGDEDQRSVRIRSASDIKFLSSEAEEDTFWSRIQYMEIGSNIVPYLGPEEFEKTVERGILHERKNLKSRVLSESFEFSGKYGSNLMEEVARYALVGSAIALDEDFDIIHAHDWLAYPAGVAAKEATGKPLIVHMHATEFDRTGQHVNDIVYGIEREGMEKADHVIAVSNLTRNTVIEKYGIPPEKVTTVHNAVEPAEKDFSGFEKQVNEKVVTFLGRITYQKGPDYFIEAARKVLNKNPNVRFVMAGSGDLLHRMVRRVAELGMGDRFHFTGFLKGTDVDRMFAMSDVFVMPSISEPFGIVPLEAMRSNVPVVISKQSGVAEILKHALKVDFWDIDGMADMIHGIVSYGGMNRMFVKHGKNEVDSLKWDHAAYHVKDVYNKVLEKFD